MRTVYAIFFWAACLFAANHVQAHALWIETAPVGKSGKAHQVRIYYGEPAEGILEKVGDWWSDVGSFTLVLQLPDGSSQQLTATAAADHYTATLTPAVEGLYTLSIVKPVKETFDGHKYQFNSTAFVKVGKAAVTTATGASEDFRVFAEAFDTAALGKPVTVNARLNGQPLKELEITVFSPNGWSKTFHSDENGVISFVPDRKGHYLVEAVYSADVEGQDFKHLHRISTWSLTIN